MKRSISISILLFCLSFCLLAQPASYSSFSTTGTHAGHEWVDLGLSVKWATCNVGASTPERNGSYFAWGETSPKSSYISSNSKYHHDKRNYYLKYNHNIDNKTVLELSDDAAHINWGGSWRMPTITEFQELIDNCIWTWTTMNGKNGCKVVSKSNGNSIFLPADGFRDGTSLGGGGASSGWYWSSSLCEGGSNIACVLIFVSSDHNTFENARFFGQFVRPVFR